MNLYFVVEDSGAGKKVYRSWLQHLFPYLSQVQAPVQIASNNYYLVSGRGYPAYKNTINAALEDIQTYPKIDHLFICVDTEELSLDEKFAEIREVLKRSTAFENTHVILHNCCI